MKRRSWRWIGVATAILAGSASSQQASPPQPKRSDGDAYFLGAEAIETCAGLYLYEASFRRDPRARDRAKAAGDAVAARLPKAAGISVEEANKLIAQRVENVGKADRDGRLSDAKRVEAVKICDKYYGQSVGVPLPEIPPPPLTAQQREDCQEVLDDAAADYQRLTGQMRPDLTHFARRREAEQICSAMQRAYNEGRLSRCPAEVMSGLKILKDGGRQLLSMSGASTDGPDSCIALD